MFALDKHGQPLDPCHPARARRLPASGRAVVHRHTPFVIRLRDRAAVDFTIQGVEVGIDPGSKHTGSAAFTERGGIRAGTYGITTQHGTVQGIGHRHVRLLQRADGYGHTLRSEAWLRAAFPSPPEGVGIHAGEI